MEDMDTSEAGDPPTNLPAAGSADQPTGSADPLLTEFSCWQVEPGCSNEKTIRLERILRSEEGQATLYCYIDQEREFKLHCPLSYPNHQDENFFVEAEPRLQLWCNAVNEFILDSKDTLSLSMVLNKSLSLYSSGDSRARTESFVVQDSGEDDIYESESEESGAEDGQLDDMLDQDFNRELEVTRRKKRWRQKEEQLRKERSEKNIQQPKPTALQDAYYDPVLKPSQPQQVFTSQGAFGILVNDLVSIMSSRGALGVEADTVDDNIFQWNVMLRNFSNRQLGEDLQRLEAEFGYDYIELQLDFSMDLYPFFPPLVKVVRPRLQGSMMLRVTSMEILKLAYWDPAKDMMSVITEIRDFLSTWARVDYKSERNDRVRYPGGAYIDIEHHLLRLALVSEVSPRANTKYVSQRPSPVKAPPLAAAVKLPPSPPQEPEVKSDEEEEEKKAKSASLFGLPFLGLTKGEKKKKDIATKKMAKGVGYSTGSHKGWDYKSMMAAQEEKNKQIELVLDKILAQLKLLHASQNQQNHHQRHLPDIIAVSSVASSSDMPPVDVNMGAAGGSHARSNSSRRKRKHSPDDGATVQDEEVGEECGPINPVTDMYIVLEGSALVPFIESKLQHNSFLEMEKHPAVYRLVVGIIRELCSHPTFLSLLGPLVHQASSIHAILQNLEPQARTMISRIGKASANGSVPKDKGKGAKKEKEEKEKSTGGDALAKEFLEVSKEVNLALKNAGVHLGHSALKDGPAPTNGAAVDHQIPQSSNNKESKEENWEEIYISALAPLQFDSTIFPESGKLVHHFNSECGNTPSYQVVCRVAQDISSLMCKGALPLNLSSSIFVRSDDDKSNLLKAVITGPEGTPYTGGIYEFDIYFPNKYPAEPPKVNFRTTGCGTVRFNPNLYQDGKVCLSLLGTWEGARGEQWNKDTSTILQVLVSIQSLILCPEPYYNEPGFDRQYGTAVGNSESKKYSEEVLKNNLKLGIIENLESPPIGFEEVVRAHFYLKRTKLIQELEEMSGEYGNSVKRLVAEVSCLLRNLDKPAFL